MVVIDMSRLTLSDTPPSLDPFLNFTERSRPFFAGFADFSCNYLSQPITEFSRLAAQRKWASGSTLWKQNWLACFGRRYQGQKLPDHGGNEFFEEHRKYGFTPNYGAPLGQEFHRLAQKMKWSNAGTIREKRLEAYGAEVRGFFPEGMSKLEQWQQLCREVLIEDADIPTSNAKCKKALETRCVNLMELMNSRRLRRAPQIFPDVQALCDYTMKGKYRVFPLQAAKEGTVVRVLLEDFRSHRRYDNWYLGKD